MVTVAAIAGALVTGGCASSTARAPSAGATPAASRAAGGTTHLSDYTDSDSASSRVILTGAIGDYGTATSADAKGALRSELDLTLTHGSFRVDIAALDKKMVGAFDHFPSDTRTCSGTVIETGAAPIVPGSGTGSYRGISGSFNLTVTIDEVLPKSKCDATAPFLSQTVVIAGPGSVSVN